MSIVKSAPHRSAAGVQRQRLHAVGQRGQARHPRVVNVLHGHDAQVAETFQRGRPVSPTGLTPSWRQDADVVDLPQRMQRRCQRILYIVDGVTEPAADHNVKAKGRFQPQTASPAKIWSWISNASGICLRGDGVGNAAGVAVRKPAVPCGPIEDVSAHTKACSKRPRDPAFTMGRMPHNS